MTGMMRQSMRPAKSHEYALEAMETNVDLCADYTRSAVKMMSTVTLQGPGAQSSILAVEWSE
jgi:hypothetical protein